MKILAKDLIGQALNFAVAQALGATFEDGHLAWPTPEGTKRELEPKNYAGDILVSGEIIYREEIQLRKIGANHWRATIDLEEGDVMVAEEDGPDQLTAALRCFIKAHQGDEVDVPAKIVNAPATQAAEQAPASPHLAGFTNAQKPLAQWVGMSAEVRRDIAERFSPHSALLEVEDWLREKNAPSPPAHTAEPLRGWKLDAVRPSADDEGVWEIGYQDPEDDVFYPVCSVDAGNCEREEDAEPLARAILAALILTQRQMSADDSETVPQDAPRG